MCFINGSSTHELHLIFNSFIQIHSFSRTCLTLKCVTAGVFLNMDYHGYELIWYLTLCLFPYFVFKYVVYISLSLGSLYLIWYLKRRLEADVDFTGTAVLITGCDSGKFSLVNSSSVFIPITYSQFHDNIYVQVYTCANGLDVGLRLIHWHMYILVLICCHEIVNK